MSHKYKLLGVVRRRAAQRIEKDKGVYPSIQVDIDPAEERNPSPLRFDDKEESESIEQQRKQSARRLLRDRYVHDGGYLQSRTPFPLDTPSWDTMDQDQPPLTPEGCLWEDINHFVDYLTCKDTKLAFELNEMLLRTPKEALKEFGAVCRLTNKPLCRHEALGRGYVFTREPVLSPSTLVGRLVLEKKTEDLEKGLRYLWVMHPQYVEKQRDSSQGFDLERLAKNALLLAEVYEVLYSSLFWTQVHFVDELKDLSLLFPDLGLSLSNIKSKFILAELLADRKVTVRRYLELQKLLKEEISCLELLNDLGSNPNLFLRSNNSDFHSIISWIQILKAAHLPWKSVMDCCLSLYQEWNQMDISIESFSHQVRTLMESSPRALSYTVKDPQTFTLVIKEIEQVVQKLQVLKENENSADELLESIPVLLTGALSLEQLQNQIVRVMDCFGDLELYGKMSIHSLISADLDLVTECESWMEDYKQLRSMVYSALTTEEMEDFKQTLAPKELINCSRKVSEVIRILEKDYHREKEDSKQLLTGLVERIRNWKSHEPLPREFPLLLNRLSANQIAELLVMDAESFEQIEKSMFLMFGRSSSFVIYCLLQMPRLLVDAECRDLALVLSRCKKTSLMNLKDKAFRCPDRHLSLLINTLKLTRSKTYLEEKAVIWFLENLSEMKLLGNDDPVKEEKRVVQLTQFLILCVEHPEAWTQFLSLMKGVVNPVLASSRPEKVQEMKKEAFRIILMAPEIFLLPDLWNAVLMKLQDDDWCFAGLDFDTVKDTEPCLLYYTVQEYWRNKYERNPMQLIAKSRVKKQSQRRGKSIVA